jgi:hypothetical protein
VYPRLLEELDAWSAAGRTARFWWRDDDASAPSPQLSRLLGLADDLKVVVALGVVPKHAEPSLARFLAGWRCCVWQHGWTHKSHKSGEFGDGRTLNAMVEDVLTGQHRMDDLFGSDGWQRVFVPPWHLVTLPFKSVLPALGYRGISTGEPLTSALDHVVEVAAEIDVMDWRVRAISTERTLEDALLARLRKRRADGAQTSRSLGLLTHHLAFDDAAWDAVSRLLRLLRSHEAVAFVKPSTLFESATMEHAGDGAGRRDVSVVITSCGRQELLVRTLDSFFEHNTYPIREFIVIEDGEHGSNSALEERYSDVGIRWLATGSRLGQIDTVDAAYAGLSTDYIFHCEDDWEFTAPGFVERSLAVLESNPAVLQVWIRALDDTNRHPLVEHVFLADGVPYRVAEPSFRTRKWGTWHGFSFNPGLRRRQDYLTIGSFRSLSPSRDKTDWEVERAASAFYVERGLLAAILADNGGKGYVHHTGWDQRVRRNESALSRLWRF